MDGTLPWPRWRRRLGWGALGLVLLRRALHAVWTQPVLEDGSARSRIFHARRALGPLP